MFPDQDFDPGRPEPANAGELVQDLELEILWSAMARSDALVRSVARAATLAPLADAAQIRYRQAVLNDALHRPETVRALYDVAGEAIDAEKSVFRSFLFERPESLLGHSVRVLELLTAVLRKLRRLADNHAHEFESDGFSGFFDRIGQELDEDYFRMVEVHLKQLTFRPGLLLSAQLGAGNRSTGLVLRRPQEKNRTLFNRGAVKKPNFSFSIPDRDEAGFRALGDLRDRVLDDVANTAAQAADHVLGFFLALRREVAFLIGCTNLSEELTRIGQPLSFPEPGTGGTALAAQDLRDPSLALSVGGAVVGNSVRAERGDLVVITGANQGGKSTLLRALGNAQLMLQAGMYVAAGSFSAPIATGVFTHYRREEDAAMDSGKLDEELARMRGITDHIRAGGLVLCNESFAATNEREGSEIASGIVHALLDSGVRVVYVTHNYDLARGLFDERTDSSVFLRAERRADGRRTFRLVPGEPLPTSYGRDLHARIFGSPTAAASSSADTA